MINQVALMLTASTLNHWVASMISCNLVIPHTSFLWVIDFDQFNFARPIRLTQGVLTKPIFLDSTCIHYPHVWPRIDSFIIFDHSKCIHIYNFIWKLFHSFDIDQSCNLY